MIQQKTFCHFQLLIMSILKIVAVCVCKRTYLSKLSLIMSAQHYIIQLSVNECPWDLLWPFMFLWRTVNWTLALCRAIYEAWGWIMPAVRQAHVSLPLWVLFSSGPCCGAQQRRDSTIALGSFLRCHSGLMSLDMVSSALFCSSKRKGPSFFLNLAKEK